MCPKNWIHYIFKAQIKRLILNFAMEQPKIKNTTYSATFTSATGGLYIREFNALRPLIDRPDFRAQLKKEVLENNYLQINAQSSRRKVINNLIPRIESAFEDFWHSFSDSQPQEQALMLFYLTLKTVPLVYDFHFGVTLPAWKGSGRTFDLFAYQMKIDELGNRFSNVAQWSDATRRQLIDIYKRILRDAGFLKEESLIAPRIPDQFYFIFLQNKAPWFLEACFVSQTERERIINLFYSAV